MADIFISYASEDRSRVEPLAKVLNEQGWSVWWDPQIPPGKTFFVVIKEALEAAKCVVVLWSKQSINSEWVLEEANDGKLREILVPAKIDPVDLPLGFGLIQAADLTDWRAETNHAGFESFLSAISDIVGPSPQPNKSEQIGEIPETRIEQQLDIQPEEGKTFQTTLRQAEPAKVKTPGPKPDTTTTTEPKSSEPHKTCNALKFGSMAAVIVLLMAGIWWWVSQRQIKEVRQNIEKLNAQTLYLENGIEKIDTLEQIDKLYTQGDTLNHQAEALNEQASEVGLVPQLKEIQNRLEQVKLQLANKVTKNSIGMEFVLVPAGSFIMGSSLGIGEASERPVHMVKIARPFYLQKTEVTQGQWEKVMGDNPSGFKECGSNCPVERVSWEDTQKFIRKLNEMEGNNKYRLPSEAEWEFAGRAGTTTLFSFGDDKNRLADYAWFRTNSDSKTHRVGTKKPNPLGIYDMHGNVLELVEDDFHQGYNGAPEDGRAWIDEPRGMFRVIRGGGWSFIARECRSAFRYAIPPDFRNYVFGFRLARSVALDS